MGMIKKSGIGVHFYANTKLKPKKVDKKVRYPLYVTVVVGQTNTQFKARLGEGTILVSEELTELEEPGLKEQLDEYAEFIKDSIVAEEPHFPNYSLAGVGSRVATYAKSLPDIVLEMRVEDLLKHIEGNGLSIENPDELGKTISPVLKLMQERKKITVFDWLYGDGKEKMRDLVEVIDIEEIKKELIFDVFELLIDPTID
jgi:hypothetical protein